MTAATWQQPGQPYGNYLTGLRQNQSIPQDFGGHLVNWLSRVGYKIPHRPSFEFAEEIRGTPDSPDPNQRRGMGAISPPRRVIFSDPWQQNVSKLASRYGKRGPFKDPQNASNVMRLMMHELMHQVSGQQDPEAYAAASPDARLWEEAAAEQAARDLMPAAFRQLFGARWDKEHHQDDLNYGNHQKAYQQLSVFGSGAGKQQDRAARVWRRKFVNALPKERERMMAEANAARAEWGKRTGR